MSPALAKQGTSRKADVSDSTSTVNGQLAYAIQIHRTLTISTSSLTKRTHVVAVGSGVIPIIHP